MFKFNPLIFTENLSLFLKWMEARYFRLVKISRNMKTLKNSGRIRRRDSAAVVTSLSFEIPEQRREMAVSRARHDKRVVVKRSEKWSSSSLFSRARSRGLALPLAPFFVTACPGAGWNQVSRGRVLPVPFTMVTLLFRSNVRFVGRRSAVKTMRVHAATRGDYESECIGTRSTARRCTQVARRYAARHLPARFLR